jgi:hypothetical protein
MEYSGRRACQLECRVACDCKRSPSLLVACRYSDLAKWYIIQLFCAVLVSL